MPAPDPYVDSFVNLNAARVLTAAVTLGVFDGLAEGPAAAAELAGRLELDPEGTELLLTALVSMGYLRAEAGRFALEPVAQRQLVSSSPETIASFVGAQSELHWDALRGLDEVIRTGDPFRFHEESQDDRSWEGYMRGLYEVTRAEHDANVALVDVEDPRTLVDVAGGHGGFSMAMCRRHPSLRATVVDLPGAAAVGRRIVAEEGFADRVDFREGDVFEVGLGEEEADVVSAFNLIHHLPAERDSALVAMAHAALRPGGMLMIGDTERPVPGSPSENGALSSLLFHAWSGGRNFASREITAWFEDAGFGDVQVHRSPTSPWRIVVTGSVAV